VNPEAWRCDLVPGDQLAAWLSRLVRIPSVSPPQAGPRAGTAGEGELASELAGLFERFGGEVHTEEVLPGRPNVYAIWRGRSDRWAAVDTHMDTVGVEQMKGDPFSGHIEDGRLYGRGAVDTKATLAGVLGLLEAMWESGVRPEPNLLIGATVDEESDAHGAPAFAAWIRREGIRVDQLAVAEPTFCGPVVAHKGVLRAEFRIEGASAHSSQPQNGRNAITAAARLVLAFDAEHGRLLSNPAASPAGPGVLTVTLLHGGTGLNVVPDSCSLSIDRRVAPGERVEEVSASLQELARRACPLPLHTTILKQISPFSQEPGTPWVRQLAGWSGREPAVVPYCTNAWAYSGLARECVVIGPGSIDQAHGDEEWVEISELEKLAGVYARWWGLA
jgi:acetylornithine deacetylase/succinyl-diaminopimelate desuccinylase-like protein